MRRGTRSGLLGLAATVLLATAGTGTATADFAIHVRGDGQIARLGELVDPAAASLPVAKRTFGDPRPTRRDRVLCPARWPGLGLLINFVDLGGGNPCTSEGNAQSARVTTARWSTARGLHVGDRVGRLRELYPNASRHGRSWWLVSRRSPFGEGRFAPLAAVVADGRVRALEVWIGGAGE